MNKSFNRNIVGICLFVLVNTAVLADEAVLPEIAPVDETPIPQLQEQMPNDATTTADDVTTPSTDAAGQALTIVLDCGDCKPSDFILQTLKETYNGKKSANAKPVTYTITAYRARNTGARLAFGMMAGKDLISGVATFDGGTSAVGDSAITILCGTDCVARNVGEMLAGLQH
ncbi:MAG TPA: hypothetical protein VIE17_06930 [Methylophilaceae bacterium]